MSPRESIGASNIELDRFLPDSFDNAANSIKISDVDKESDGSENALPAAAEVDQQPKEKSDKNNNNN